MAEDPFKAMNLSRREYLSKYGQSVIDSPNSNISDREDALVVKEGLANQRGREAQQQFYDVAPSAREAFLEDNAVISASPQFGQVQGYMGEVRRAGPTYADNVLRKSIASNLPAAYRGRFDELVDAGAGVNEARTQVELEKEDEDLSLDLIDVGIHPDEVETLRDPQTGFINPRQARWLKSQKSRESTSRGESPAIKAMKDNYEILRQTAKDIEGEYGRPKPGADPEYDNAVAQMASLRRQIIAANSSVYTQPAEGAVVDPAAVPAPEAVAGPEVAVDDPRTLREKLAGAAPMFPAPEVKPPLVSGATDPQEYLTRIKAKGISQAERVAAYEQFKKDYDAGNFKANPNATMGEALAERKERARMLEEARVEVDLAPVRQQYEAAWGEAKSTLDKEIEAFAREIGVEKEQVLNSLKADEMVPVETKWGAPGQKAPVVDLLADYLKPKIGSVFRKVPNLEPFAKGDFADKLGMGFFSSGAKTWGDVLDAYIAEHKAAPLAATTPVEDLPRPQTPAEAKALPKGTKYLRPDGQIGYVP